jgi:glycosyltransferase involved in cell wall biosynthesis
VDELLLSEPFEAGHGPRDDLVVGAVDLEDRDVVDISVVMPCLNEEASVGICVAKAWEGIARSGLRGEVIVADNGSSDRSVAQAVAAGAQVVHQGARGYGNAYLTGFGAARGRIIVMGDSDDSYDFTAIPDLIRPIAQGYDYVLGSRFSGEIRKGAMSWSHRYIGNPVLTAILNLMFRLRVSDAHSGFRAMTRDALDKLSLQCDGMEFASEIVVKAARARLRTAEVPITYSPRIGVSKLNALEDGWRHLRFLLLLSPEYLFVVPGIVFTALGFLGQMGLLWTTGSVALAWKVALALTTLSGSQLLTFGLSAKTHARNIGLGENNRISDWLDKRFTLAHGLLLGTTLAVASLVLLVVGRIVDPDSIGAGGVATSVTILELTGLVLGAKLWFDAFFLTIVRLKRPAPQASRSANVLRDADRD